MKFDNYFYQMKQSYSYLYSDFYLWSNCLQFLFTTLTFIWRKTYCAESYHQILLPGISSKCNFIQTFWLCHLLNLKKACYSIVHCKYQVENRAIIQHNMCFFIPTSTLIKLVKRQKFKYFFHLFVFFPFSII